MENKGQVSVEYLLSVLFAIILVIAAAILLDNIRVITQVAKSRIVSYREDMVISLLE